LPYVEKNFPTLNIRQAQRWIAAAENIVKFLPPPPALEVEISVLLTADTAKLSQPAQQYRQELLGLNNHTTLKDAASGVFNEGDEAHRITRAANGKLKGGRGETDRRDFALFTARKLNHLGSHLRHWSRMPAAQRAEAGHILRSAILGNRINLTRQGRDEVFKFNLWPDEFCQVALETLRDVLKTRKNS
jgi:hypothetical protein